MLFRHSYTSLPTRYIYSYQSRSRIHSHILSCPHVSILLCFGSPFQAMVYDLLGIKKNVYTYVYNN